MRLRVICLSPRTNPTRLPTGPSRETVGALHQLRQPLSYTDGLTAAWNPPTVTVTTRPAGCRIVHRHKLYSTSSGAMPQADQTCFLTTCDRGTIAVASVIDIDIQKRRITRGGYEQTRGCAPGAPGQPARRRVARSFLRARMINAFLDFAKRHSTAPDLDQRHRHGEYQRPQHEAGRAEGKDPAEHTDEDGHRVDA